MDNENEYQDVEQEIAPEEETTEEELELGEEGDASLPEDDSVSISKSEFTKLKRKAIAYDSAKQTVKETPKETVSSGLSYDALFAVKDISKSEFEALQGEAEELGVPFEKYIKTESSKVFLKNLQTKQKSKNANEPLNSKSPVYKKFTQEDLSKMSAKEMEKILQE